MNYLASFLVKQYLKLIPSNRFILVLGTKRSKATAIACQLVISEKFRAVSLDGGFGRNLFKITPKIEKVILSRLLPDLLNGQSMVDVISPNICLIADLSDLPNEHEVRGEPDFKLNKLSSFLSFGKCVILNWEDKNSRFLAEEAEAENILCGFDSQNCHVWAGNMRILNYQTVFELNYGVERVEVRTKLLGFHQIPPLLLAAALGIKLNFPLTTIKKGLEKIEQLPQRLQVLSGHNGSIIIDDTLDADPNSVAHAIETLSLLAARRRILVLGEMRNLGEGSERFHQQIARLIYSHKLDLVFLGGGEALIVAKELESLGFLEERLQKGLQNPQIVGKLLKSVLRGDVVLVTGAPGLRFDEVVKKISKAN